MTVGYGELTIGQVQIVPASNYWKGKFMLFAEVPRLIGPNEVLDLTKQISRLAGADQ
jgi:hypothetical protein